MPAILPAPSASPALPFPSAALRPLAGELLLTAWEAGLRTPEIRRPLTLLSAALTGPALTELGPADLAALPIAARDLALLRLRELTFGPELAVFGTCPQCAQRLEFTLRADELADGLAAAAAAGPVEWTEDGQRYRLRPVTTADLAAALAVPDPETAQEFLIARCLEVLSMAAAEPAGGVPAGAVRRFEDLHGEAELRCAIDCPACGAQHVHDLDIARFLWREVSVAARRLLGEVHLLATAYGWAERDIVRLSPRRRAAYLDLVAG